MLITVPVKPSTRAENKVDIAYVYYLPFCHVFVSTDNLHKRVVPLFLRPDQTFVDAAELEADLQKLDAYYWALPEDVKNTGFYKFAKHPPLDDSFLVTRLWDKRGFEWREQASKPHPRVESDHRGRQVERSQCAAIDRRNAIYADHQNRYAKEGKVGPLWTRSQMTIRAGVNIRATQVGNHR